MKPSKGSNQSIDFSVTIDKEASGLGLEIVGGSDTYLGEVIVKSIEPKSAASRDGRIAVGDQLVMINNKNLRGMKHSSAVSSLRLASSPITITVLREDPESIFTSREEPSTVFEVKLIKSITDHLGLSILARKDRRGVFVTYVSEDGVAYKDGSIHQGDKILEVNGQNLKQSTQQEACEAISRIFGTVTLKIGRISSLHSSLYISNHSASYINQALSDNDEESVPSKKGTEIFETLEKFRYLNREDIEVTLNKTAGGMEVSKKERICKEKDGKYV